jgi:excisionase family DNA binding protein
MPGDGFLLGFPVVLNEIAKNISKPVESRPRRKQQKLQTDSSVLLTMAEAAERLRLGKTIIQQLVLRGELRSIKIGAARRIPVKALDEFVEERLALT